MMLQWLIHIDRDLFLFLNGLHCPFMDVAMTWLTKPVIWLPLFLVLFYITARTFRWKTLWVILGVAVVITISDQFANLAKHGVQRPRPTHDPAIEMQVHTVDGYKGGEFGFYSGHASSTFAVSCFLIILLRRRYRWIIPVMLSWALVMSYTRIYLGVHFPGDILAGMAAGSLIGLAGGLIFERVKCFCPAG